MTLVVFWISAVVFIYGLLAVSELLLENRGNISLLRKGRAAQRSVINADEVEPTDTGRYRVKLMMAQVDLERRKKESEQATSIVVDEQASNEAELENSILPDPFSGEELEKR